MSDHKEIWIIRHADVVAADDYDFDLSRRGRRNAQMLGWYMAHHEMALPALMLHTRKQRTESTAKNIVQGLMQSGQPTKDILYGIYSMPTEDEQGFPRLMQIMWSLDQVAQPGKAAINTALFITHVANELPFKVFGSLMTATEHKSLIEQNSQSAQEIDQLLKVMNQFAPQRFANAEIIRMRFPSTLWKNIEIGTGTVIQRATPATIREAYKEARRRKQTMKALPKVLAR